MSTRSITYIFDRGWGKEDDPDKPSIIAAVYRQGDGYPSGMGSDLANFLKDLKVVNGISFDEKSRIANGPGDLAAQLVVYLKSDSPVGGIYLEPPKLRPAKESDIEFEYHVSSGYDLKPIEMAVYRVDGYASKPGKKLLWSGHPREYASWLKKYEKEHG